MNRTKIICTSGPSVASEAKMEALVKNGMSVIRFNCSHGDAKVRSQDMKIIRKVEEKLKLPIGVMLDLQGPKLRLGKLPKPFHINEDEIWTLKTKGEADEAAKEMTVGFTTLPQSVEVGDPLFIHDGLIQAKVISKDKHSVKIKVIHGGVCDSRKGVNIPHYKGPLSALSEKDKEDLKWGLKNKVDFVALSFVRSVKDILRLKKEIAKYKVKYPPLIIAKIEKPAAVEDMESIIIECDGILVARGDLGVELPPEQVPVVQKKLIEMCRYHRTPVIVATQMLDSMRFQAVPTRAEVSDVASAIYAGADAVMLTGETSAGKYPIKATSMMNRIIAEVEGHMVLKDYRKTPEDFGLQSYRRAFAFNAVRMADDVDAKAIVVINRRGESTKRISKIHPKQPVYSMAMNKTSYRQLNLFWGVFPIDMPERETKKRIEKGVKILKKKKVVKKDDRIVFVFRDFGADHLNIKVVEVD